MNGVAGSPDACLRCGGDVAADRDFCDWCGGVHPELCTCPQCDRDRLLSHPDGTEFDFAPDETTPVDSDAVVLHRLKQLRPDGRLALLGEGWDQYQWADAGELLRYLLWGSQ